jgi:LytS/YehU family sensor histidine kinase
MRYYLPRQERYWYLLIISLAISAVWLVVVRVLLWLLLNDDEVYITILRQSSFIRYAVAFLMVGCMAMMSLLWYTQQEQKEADARKTEAEKMAKDAELYKLRQQLQPHFLFNSLNSISALTGSQPEKARHMIQQLSDFFRGTLKKDELVWITLKEELEYLQLYLNIEKVRFGYRLNTLVVHDEDVLQMKLPAMLLQPVVENAIKFGLYDTTGEVIITITAKNVNGFLQVTVQNPFDAETSQPLQGSGFGLVSIRRRLFLLFARHDLLNTEKENNYFITTVTIPQVI